MYCGECGFKNQKGDRFCAECGKPLQEEKTTPKEKVVSKQPPKPRKPMSKKTKIGIIIVAIILLAIALNLSTVWNGIKVFLDIISPFIWGLAIAFIINIFMTFYENIVFKSRNKNANKRVKNDEKKARKKKTSTMQ